MARADRNLYVNADRSKVVEEGDPSSAYLLVAKGSDIKPGEIGPELMKQIKAVNSGEEEKPVEEAQASAGEEPAADDGGEKAISEPPENKARTSARERKS